MNFKENLSLGALAFAVAACAHPSSVGIGQSGEDLTPTQLIATAESRVGQTATVVGYFTWRTDTRALWQDRAAWLDAQTKRKGEDFDYWSKCITIYQKDGSARSFSDQRVRVTGKVLILSADTFWTCNRVTLGNAVLSRAKVL